MSFERRLPWDVSVDMAYVGTAKNGGFTDIDANASDVPGGGAASRPLSPRHGRNNSLLLWGPFAKSRYHSLQVAINRPFKNGLMLKGAYTLSRAKNEVDDDGWSQLTWSAPSLRSRNYALAGYDRPHMFNMAFVYELPYKTSTSKDIAHLILGDWQVNGIYSAVSGTPFTITANGATLNMPGSLQTANLNGDYKVIGDKGDSGTTSTRRRSASRRESFGQHRPQPVPRSRLLEHRLLDLPRVPDRRWRQAAEFRTEFFNLTNTPKWGRPVGDMTSGNFGRVTTVGNDGRGNGARETRAPASGRSASGCGSSSREGNGCRLRAAGRDTIAGGDFGLRRRFSVRRALRFSKRSCILE